MRTFARTTTTSRSSAGSLIAGSPRPTSNGSSPGLVGGLVGGVSFDEWGVDGARLCVLNALDAIEHGARVHVHTTVESIGRVPEPAGAARYVVEARERFGGSVVRVRARPS
jgi:glycerol-3-phosphate dehydrogenase